MFRGIVELMTKEPMEVVLSTMRSRCECSVPLWIAGARKLIGAGQRVRGRGRHSATGTRFDGMVSQSHALARLGRDTSTLTPLVAVCQLRSDNLLPFTVGNMGRKDSWILYAPSSSTIKCGLIVATSCSNLTWAHVTVFKEGRHQVSLPSRSDRVKFTAGTSLMQVWKSFPSRLATMCIITYKDDEERGVRWQSRTLRQRDGLGWLRGPCKREIREHQASEYIYVFPVGSCQFQAYKNDVSLRKNSELGSHQISILWSCGLPGSLRTSTVSSHQISRWSKHEEHGVL